MCILGQGREKIKEETQSRERSSMHKGAELNGPGFGNYEKDRLRVYGEKVG